MHPDDTVSCFAAHMGVWACYEPAMRQALWALEHGVLPIRAASEQRRGEQPLYGRTETGVAIVSVVGALTKYMGKFTGTATTWLRTALRQAMADEEVRSILLAIDSPGGQVSGLAEVVDDIMLARQRKPVMAYIEDLGASGAYWIASATQRITANASALVGSIGAFTVLEDSSGAAEREGIVVRVVSTGPYKGLGVPGTPITDSMVDETQRLVDQFGARFFSAVQRGRGLSAAGLTRVTDGRVHMAADAQELGLIDSIQTFEQAVESAARARLSPRPARAVRVASGEREALTAARARWNIGE